MASIHQFLVDYGAAVVARNAGLFVGAGLSKPAYPTWQELLEEPMASAGVPTQMTDLPLAAEYCVQALEIGRDRLEAHLLGELAPILQ